MTERFLYVRCNSGSPLNAARFVRGVLGERYVRVKGANPAARFGLARGVYCVRLWTHRSLDNPAGIWSDPADSVRDLGLMSLERNMVIGLIVVMVVLELTIIGEKWLF